MILSKTAEHAIRVLAYMARNGDKPYSAAFLHKELDIPYKYLAQLMTKMAKGGLLKPIKGRDGGFVFTGSVKQTHLSDILKVIENYDAYDGCVLGCDQCSGEDPCLLHDPWSEIRGRINRFLRETSLEDVISMPTFKI